MSSEALDLLEKPHWFKYAACRGVGPERFFLEEITFSLFRKFYLRSEKSFKRLRKSDLEEIRREIEKANKEEFCNKCVVRSECSLKGKYEAYGQWGGKNLEERFAEMEETEQWKFFKMKEQRDKNL